MLSFGGRTRKVPSASVLTFSFSAVNSDAGRSEPGAARLNVDCSLVHRLEEAPDRHAQRRRFGRACRQTCDYGRAVPRAPARCNSAYAPGCVRTTAARSRRPSSGQCRTSCTLTFQASRRSESTFLSAAISAPPPLLLTDIPTASLLTRNQASELPTQASLRFANWSPSSQDHLPLSGGLGGFSRISTVRLPGRAIHGAL